MFRLSSASNCTFGNKIPHILRPHGTGEHCQSGNPRCTSPAVAEVRHHVRLHTRVSKKAASTASTVFLARLPEPATENDCSGLTSFNPVGLTSLNPAGGRRTYLLRTGGLRALSVPIPGVGLGWLVSHTERAALGGIVPRTEIMALEGLVPLAESTILGVPRTEYAVLGGLPLTSTAFHGFRTHEPRIRIDGLSASSWRFVDRVSAFVATAEDCTGRRPISAAAETFFALVLAIPIESGMGSAQAVTAATPIAQPTPLSRSSAQDTDSSVATSSTVSVSHLLQSLRRRRCADEQRQQPVMHPRCRL